MMKKSLKAVFTLIIGGLVSSAVGCATSVKYSRVSDVEYPAKAENCEFKIQSRFPDQSFEEIGTVNLSTNSDGENAASTLSKFRALIQKEVCRSGADLVVPDINGRGYYLRAIVFKHVSK
jgi:hypothetical protein